LALIWRNASIRKVGRQKGEENFLTARAGHLPAPWPQNRGDDRGREITQANARNVVAQRRFNLTGDVFAAHQSSFTKFLASFSLMGRPVGPFRLAEVRQ
jgi:hypothetical protein